MIILGDFHGAWNAIQTQIEKFGIKNETIICVGDAEIGFNSDAAQELNKLHEIGDWFAKRNIQFLTIRGNHDNPFWFPQKIHPNLELVGDYVQRTIEGKRILFIGGAVSIDRHLRIEGRDYWSEEIIVEPSSKIVDHVDIVVAHDFPIFFGPSSHNLDNDVRLDCIVGRQILQEVWETARPRFWYGGHHHFSLTQEIRGTVFKIVNINELVEVR